MLPGTVETNFSVPGNLACAGSGLPPGAGAEVATTRSPREGLAGAIFCADGTNDSERAAGPPRAKAHAKPAATKATAIDHIILTSLLDANRCEMLTFFRFFEQGRLTRINAD